MRPVASVAARRSVSLVAAVLAVAGSLPVLPPAPAAALTRPLFLPALTFPTTSSGEAVAIGDITGDGRNDVVMVTGYANRPDDFRLFTYVQQPDGAVTPAASYATAARYQNRIRSVAIGDVTGDGLPDVVLGVDRDRIQVFPQQGGALGTPFDLITTDSTNVALGDVNGDSRQDIVGSGWGSDTATVFLQSATGFVAPSTWPVLHDGYDDLAIGDVTGDGRDDIVSMSGQGLGPDFGVLSQLPAGGFASAVYYSAGDRLTTWGVAIGDVNSDGRNDVLAAIWGNQPTSAVDVFTQNATGSLNAPPQSLRSLDLALGLKVADVDLDGRNDVIVAHGHYQAIGVYRQQSDGTLGPETTFAIPTSQAFQAGKLSVGDVNGDGAVDVAVATDHALAIVLNTTTMPPPTVPDAPTLAPLVVNASTISLSWTKPASDGGSPVTDYALYRRAGSGAEVRLGTTSATNLTAMDPNVTGGTTYTYRVAAINAIGEGPASNEEEALFPVRVPGQVTITSVDGDSSSLTVWWKAPASDGGSPITGYNIYRGSTATSTTLLNTVTQSGAFTDTSVVQGEKWFYQVAAVNAVGEGPRSLAVSRVVGLVPSAPVLLGADVLDGAVVRFRWSASASDGGSPITAYTVKWLLPYTSNLCTSSGLTCTQAGLPVNQDLTVAVVAANAVGLSPQSNTLTFRIPPTPPSAPNFHVPQIAAGSVHLTWNASTYSGTSPITGYRIYRGTVQGNGSLLTTLSPSTTSYDDRAVTPGGTYWYKATAVNAAGESGYDTEFEVEYGLVPTTPTITSVTPGDGQLAVTWMPPDSDGGWPLTYWVVASPGSAHCSGNADARSCTLTGLTNGTQYSVSIRAINQIGEGAFSSPLAATPVGRPGAPAITAATSAADGLHLTWTAPLTDGGLAITSYNVFRGSSTGTATLVQTIAGATTWTDAAAPAGSTAYYQVAAVNAAGEGPRSGEWAVTVVGRPGAPVLTAATAGNTSIAATWQAPTSNGGSAITGYTATATPGGATCSSTSLTCTITGLTNGTTYAVSVAARNAVGVGPASNTLTAKPAPAGAPPSAPRLPTATPNNATGIGLAWTAPLTSGTSTVTGYRIYRSTTAGAEVFLASVGNVLAFTDTSVVNGGRYYYQVSAVNAVGEGPRSTELVTTRGTAPSEPRLVIATGQGSSIRLAWFAPSSTGGAAVTGYRIYRSTTSGAETLLTTIGSQTAYTDMTAPRGVKVYYRVAAVNVLGTGPQSGEVSATAR